MIETQMNTMTLAKKLRARQAELKAKRAVALKAYATAFEAWKSALGTHIARNASKRAKAITRELVQSSYRGDGYKEHMLSDSPKPPRFPKDDTIQKIATMLRHLAITGQKTVRLTEADVHKLFVDHDESDDD